MTKSRRECTQEKFDKDVRDHELTVLKDDDGYYRHLRFKNPESGAYFFDIITWPGHLCFTGDMGTQTFARVTDMLNFFRDFGKPEYRINPEYWGEKLLSTSHFGGYEEFDRDVFKKNLREDFDQQHECVDDEVKEGAWTEVQEEIIDWLEDDDMSSAIRRAMDFKSDYGTEFVDFYEYNFTRFTFHYIWCCYALVWAIRKYDAYKDDEKAREVT